MIELLHEELFAGFTVKEVGIALIAVLVFFGLVRAVFGRRRGGADNFKEAALCPRCGWSGEVGRYNRTCRGCGASI